jgi:hypothetical protein
MSSSKNEESTARFVREKFFPSSWSTTTERFCSLFHRYGYIYKPLNGGSWLSAEEKWQLTDSEILKAIACAHQKFFIGTRSGRATRFAVLDIDAGSQYHTPLEVNRIRETLSDAGINQLVTYRSSSSGGWHLYIFFDQPVSARDLNRQLTLILQLNNFDVQKGQLEVFPNPGQAASLGQGLRLPMQPGWAWLHPVTMESEIERQDISALEALDLFMNDLDNSSNTRHDFHRLKRHVDDMLSSKQTVHNLPGCSASNDANPIQNLGTPALTPSHPRERRQLAGLSITLAPAQTENLANQITPIRPAQHGASNVVPIYKRDRSPTSPESILIVEQIFTHLPPGILADVWIRGRDYFTKGLSGPSQRSDAIFSIGHYLFYGDPQIELPALGYGCEDERQWLLEAILSTKHNGHSNDLNRGRSDAIAQVRRAAHWRPASRQDENNTAYTSAVPVSWILENARRKRDARQRIRQAIDELKASGRNFTATDIRTKARCSWSTLYKHEDLWKQDYLRAAEPRCHSNSSVEYEQISADIFAISTHEYNAGVGEPACPSACSPTAPASISDFSAAVLDCPGFCSEFQIGGERIEGSKEKTVNSNCRRDDRCWKDSIVAVVLSELSRFDISELKRLLAFLVWLRASVPDYESGVWANRVIVRLRDQIGACSSQDSFFAHGPPWTG